MSRPSSVTAPLREERLRLRESLAAIAERVGELARLPMEGRSAAMKQVAAELDERLRPHLEWEERTIHPIVDKFACEGPAAFSASMQYEHEIIFRSIGELRWRSLDAAAVVAFSRRADNLLGIVLAHFELEEEVLFPIIDRALSRTSDSSVVAPPRHTASLEPLAGSSCGTAQPDESRARR
jgi:hemerythrin-like domain-containing protein